MRIATLTALGLIALNLAACATPTQVASNVRRSDPPRRPFQGVTMPASSPSGIGTLPLFCRSPLTGPRTISC